MTMLHHPALYRTDERVVSGNGVKSRVSHRVGDFLGFYSGMVLSPGAYDACDLETSRRSFEISATDGYVVVRERDDDIIGFVNEPPVGHTANVVAVPLHLDFGNAVGYFASHPIVANTELWVHYGHEFDRDYAVGEQGLEPPSLQRADAVIGLLTMRSERRRFSAPRPKRRSGTRSSRTATHAADVTELRGPRGRRGRGTRART